MKENEQNFDELKKLLQLKQREVPPPGYFNGFSDKVVARIKSGQVAKMGSAYERLQSTAPWLARLLANFESRPSVMAGFAVSICLLLVLGVVLTEKSETASIGLVADLQNPTPTGLSIASIDNSQMLADSGGGIQISTNPVSLQPAANLFGQQNPLLPASFAH